MPMFFSQKAATLKTSEKETSYNNYKTQKPSKASQNTNTPGCFCNKEKESQIEKQEGDICKKANKNMAIVRSLDSKWL